MGETKIVAWRGRGVVSTETVTGTMTGSMTGIAPGDGSTTGIEEDIRTRATRWRCRGIGDGAPNRWRRARMRVSGCTPRGMGTPRERRGPEAGCPRMPDAPGAAGGAPQTPEQLPQCAVRAECGRTAP